MPSLKNPKADLRKSYLRTFEISLIINGGIRLSNIIGGPYRIKVAKIEPSNGPK